jgi:hypothetical protein
LFLAIFASFASSTATLSARISQIEQYRDARRERYRLEALQTSFAPENVFDVYMQYWKDKNTLGKLVEEKLSGMAVKSALTLHLRRGT